MTIIERDTSGVFAIAPTPFTRAGDVDLDSIDRLVGYYSDAGTHGLTILGQLGEAGKLDNDEARAVAGRFLQRSALPTIVGVSAPGFAAMKSLSAFVMDRGAAGVMVAPPTHLRTDDQIVRYYAQAAEALGSDVPLVIQDYPLTFSVVMSSTVIQRIANQVRSCVMLKHEDWPGLGKISAVRQFEAQGEMPRLSILCGNGGLFLDFELERGADGAMTGYCFTEALVAIVDAAKQGDRSRAHRIFDAHLPLMRYEQQPGIGLGVRKYVLAKRGVLATATQRVPAAALSDPDIAEVEYLLERLYAHDDSAVHE